MRLRETEASAASPHSMGVPRLAASPLFMAVALLLAAFLLLSACAAPHEDAFEEAERTPAPMPGASVSAAVPTPTPSPSIAPSAVSTPKPLPTLAPASSPDELYALSFMTDRAVFAVFGVWGSKTGVKFFDLESSPFVPEDAANGLEDGVMVHAAQVLRALGYEIESESDQGLTARSEESTLQFTAGFAETLVNGAKTAPPKSVPAALWHEDCLWVSTRVLPLPAVVGVGEEHGMLTYDARRDNNAAGRAAAAEAGLDIWGVYPK